VQVLGAVVAGIVGFGVGILVTEVIFANDKSWPDVVPIALAVLGGLVGASLGRRRAARRTLS
jgi:hypothetical protein